MHPPRARRAGGGLLPAPIAHIARDPMDPAFSLDDAVAAIRRRRTELKRALLDQTAVSGIGNIYADEALWRARLHGARPTEKLTRAQGRAVLTAAAEVMDEALAQGGTSFDALYVNVNGASGYFDRSLAAYGQADRPCPRCGTPIRREPFMNRSSFSCPRCQPRPRARASALMAGSAHSQSLRLNRAQSRPAAATISEQRERVAQRPVQLGHVVEVHPVDPGDQRRREGDRRPRRDPLDLLVLLEARLGEPRHLVVLPLRDERGLHVDQVGQQRPEVLDALQHPRRVVLDVAHPPAQLDVGVLAVLAEPPAQLREDVAQRLDGAVEGDDLAGELVDPLRHRRVAAEDLLLDLVDVVLQALEHGQVVVDDPVQHAPEHRVRAVGEQLRVVLEALADHREVRLVGVPDGDRELGPEEQVQLAELDHLDGVDVAGGAQHDEGGVAVALQLGPLVLVDGVLDGQLVQVELVGDGVDLVASGAQHADPGEAAAVVGAAAQRARTRCPATAARACGGRRRRSRCPPPTPAHPLPGSSVTAVGATTGSERAIARDVRSVPARPTGYLARL